MIKKILCERKARLIDACIPCRVIDQKKHLYSIYLKMHLKEQRFHSIMDIYLFKVIVKNRCLISSTR